VKLSLIMHPESDSASVESIVVEFVREQASLTARFVLRGAIEHLALPAPAPSERIVGLWRHTCFEVFVRPADGSGYCELNFSPSSQWAAYRFDGYRTDMDDAALSALSVACSSSHRTVELSAAVTLDWPDPTLDWMIGVSAVIETRDGSRAYWALAHPPGVPDFHHADCFAARIAPSNAP
jgi:hypothetical protein